jgi:hypothetical protein
MIDSTFWEKHDWHHILGKNMIDRKCWKNVVGSTFWKKYIIGRKFCVKT